MTGGLSFFIDTKRRQSTITSVELIDRHPAPEADIAEASVSGARSQRLAEAVVLTGDRSVSLDTLTLREPTEADVLVETELTGISTGTEKLFWSGDMPPFPGMGYPLVPGYESVGRVVAAPRGSDLLGQRVFVPGAHGFEDVRCLFGGAAARLVAPAARVYPIGDLDPEHGILLSLAATAYHAIDGHEAPDLIVGFGILGRLLFRITEALGQERPAVWEISPERAEAEGIVATSAEHDPRKDYRSIYDVSGSMSVIDQLVGAMARGGTIVCAGFYPGRFGFNFAPAFQKEATFRIAAEWTPADLHSVLDLIADNRLSLDGLVTHVRPWREAPAAYETAFTDPACLKMTLDWRIQRG